MNVIDIRLVNGKCVVLVEKNSEKVKYTFSLDNPDLLKYVNKLVQKKERLLRSAIDDMESDYFGKKARNAFLCYGISGLISFFVFSFTLYANEIIGMLGMLGVTIISAFGHLIFKSIPYDADPKKTKKVEELKNETDEIKKIESLVYEQINAKEMREEQKKEQERLEKKRKQFEKLKQDAIDYVEQKKMDKLRSTMIHPYESIILDDIINEVRFTYEFRDMRYEQIRDYFFKKFLEIKNNNPKIKDADILKGILREVKEKKNRKK